MFDQTSAQIASVASSGLLVLETFGPSSLEPQLGLLRTFEVAAQKRKNATTQATEMRQLDGLEKM